MTDKEKLERDIAKLCVWHKWFAWFPVRIVHPISGRTYKVWMETVGRKCKVTGISDGEYGSKDGVVTEKYCFIEDIIVNTLSDNELTDER